MLNIETVKSAVGQIIVQILDGKINFTAKAQTIPLEKGQMIALQPNIPHSVLAVNESFFMLTVFTVNAGS